MGTTAEKTKSEFQLELEAEQLTAEAKTAAGALEQLRKSIDSDSRALAEMQKAMRNLQSSSVVNVAAYRQLKQQMDLKRESIAKAQASYVSLGGEFTKSSSGAGSLAKRFAELQKTTQLMPGPIGNVVSRLGALKGLLAGGAIALGIAAIAAAMVALTVAAGAAVKALYQYGVAQSDVVRTEKIRLEGLTKLRFWYQKIPGDAQAMQDGIDRVSAKSALSRAEIVKLNDQLYRLGFRGENLALTLDAAQMKMSVQGDAAAQRFIGWATTANMAGESVKRLSDRVKADIGGQANRLLSSTTVQAEKLRESFALLTSGLKLDRYLDAWREFNELFSQSTETGRALKQLFEHLFQPLVDGMTKAAPLAKRFFQGLVIAALDFEIAILDLRLWLKDTFGSSEITDGLFTMENALKAGKIAFWGLLVVVAPLAVALTAVGVAAYGVYRQIKFFWHDLPRAVMEGWSIISEAWKKFDFAALGVAIIDGIMRPLKAGWAIIGEWFDKLGGNIIKRFKASIKSESPSKLFADAAVEIPRGVAVGIERGTPEAQAAADKMVTPPEGAASSAAAAGTAAAAGHAAGRGGATANVTIGELHVHSQASDPHGFAVDVRRELESILQGLAFQLGTEPEGAT